MLCYKMSMLDDIVQELREKTVRIDDTGSAAEKSCFTNGLHGNIEYVFAGDKVRDAYETGLRWFFLGIRLEGDYAREIAAETTSFRVGFFDRFVAARESAREATHLARFKEKLEDRATRVSQGTLAERHYTDYLRGGLLALGAVYEFTSAVVPELIYNTLTLHHLEMHPHLRMQKARQLTESRLAAISAEKRSLWDRYENPGNPNPGTPFTLAERERLAELRERVKREHPDRLLS